MSDMVRNHRLDLIRVIALVMIVLMHSPMPECAHGFVLAGISYLTTPGIGLFFMISGALLLGNNLSAKEFLKRRFTKILFPTLFWTVFYLIIKCYSEPMALKSLFRSIFSIPFSARSRYSVVYVYTGWLVSIDTNPDVLVENRIKKRSGVLSSFVDNYTSLSIFGVDIINE